MQRIDKNGSVLKLSLLALAIVAMTGCSSNDSSSQPLNPGEGTGGGGGGTDGGGSGSDGGGTDGGGSDGGDAGQGDGGQDFTYKTINPVEAIPVGEEFHLDSVSINATPSSSGIAINQQPVLDHAAMIEVLPNDSDGRSRVRLNAPIAGIEDRDFTEGDLPYDFFNGEDNDVKLRSMEDNSQQFLDGSLNYAVFGEWLIRNSGGDSDGSFFASGYDTHSMDMPTTGSAEYSGATSGTVIIDNGLARDLVGQANLSVNFADKTLNGSLTNMNAIERDTDTADLPWNDINLAGGLDDSGNRFAGITEVISSPGNAASLSTDSEGELRGRFYGPEAAEAAGVWSVKDPNGSAAYGSFGVKKN
ncbi:transferrin-binding protein-like solute binding protein [Halomonas sp. ATBC28]|uniref:transferrin-binding protein-like solute binding protein n=1 Tax=unclassified Halomonas TaxID=2609666 RepID=UPI00110D2808|nr:MULTISPECIES: transferrin-binding protein-like solute binding protein [unclassified Halomonas]MCD1585629.1 transferrin-binding protein-like solute binding protein [Halomonas sp. IOP_14]TMU23759.1 transferrin-binding protein-like solute binding protein [Halomonas sp. ATBC28]